MIRHAVFAAALLSVSLSVVVRAEVDVQLAAKAKIKGSISPDGDLDTFRFEAARASTVALTLKAKKGLDPAVTITGPGPVDVPLSGAAKLVDQGRKVLVKKLLLPAHGDYTLVVSGVGSGDYTLKLNVVPAKVLETSFALAGLETAQIVAPAPDGADVVFTAKAARGSPVVPELLAQPKASSASLTLADVSGPGDVAVDVRNASSDGGDVDLVVKIKPVKVKTQKVDVRSKTLAKQGGGETAVGATLGAGGGVVAVGEGDLAGAGVDVPPGALDGDTLISVSSTANVDVPDGGNLGAGPSVEFGPDGIEFSQPVDVTVPYDPNSIPEGANAADVLQVVREESDGSQTTLPPSSVGSGTITVQTSGFSRFRAFVPRGRPRISGGEFWFVETKFGFEPDELDGGDSRDRIATMGVGEVTFGDEGVIGDSSVTLREDQVRFGHDQTPEPLVDATPGSFGGPALTWNYGSDGQTILVGEPGEPPDTFFVSEDGRFLSVSARDEPDELGAFLALLGRKPSHEVTLADLAGEFWFGVVSFGVDAFGGPALEMEVGRNFGTLEIAADGAATLSGDGFFKGWFGRFETERDRFSGGAVVTVDTAPGTLQGSALLAIEGDADTFRLLPVAGGDVLFGLRDDMGSSPSLLIIVRKSADASTATIAGERSNSALFIDDIVTYDVQDQFFEDVTLPDIRVSNIRERISVQADGTADPFDITELVFFRDPAVPSGVRRMEVSDGSDGARLSVDRKGKLGSRVRSDPTLGAVSPNGVFVFAMVGITSPEEFGFDISLRLPPEITITAK